MAIDHLAIWFNLIALSAIVVAGMKLHESNRADAHWLLRILILALIASALWDAIDTLAQQAAPPLSTSLFRSAVALLLLLAPRIVFHAA